MTNKIFIALQLLIVALGIYNIIGGYFDENIWQVSTGNWMILAVGGFMGLKSNKEDKSNA